MKFNLINVGIADYKVSSSPDILRTILGSCVGVCLYDPRSLIGGMCHIMLPTYKDDSGSHKKYADTAIPMMLKEIEEKGCDRGKIVAKVIGGARMFKVTERSLMGEIGFNNINKVHDVLKSLKIRVISEDTGGNYGRTIDFYLVNGDVKIRSLGRNERII
jgi:chemotaxis protein CheD